MPGMSPLSSISRWGVCHLKKVGGGFRGPFCDQKLEVPTFLFGDVFCMRGGPPRKKTPLVGISTAVTLAFNRSIFTLKIVPKTSLSTLMGDQAALTLVINHSSFIKWSLVCEVSRGQGGVSILQMGSPRPQKQVIGQKASKIPQKNVTFCSVESSNRCYIGNQPFYIYSMIISKVFRVQAWLHDHKGASRPQKRPNSAKMSKIVPKSSLSTLLGDQIAITSAINHSIFIKWS